MTLTTRGRYVEHMSIPAEAPPGTRPVRGGEQVTTAGAGGPDEEDLLLADDPERAADHALMENLLRCRVRESGTPVPETGELRLPLPASGTIVVAPVLYRSETGWHRFGRVRLRTGVALDATTLAALMALETAHGRRRSAGAVADLVDRVVDSGRRTARHLAVRRARPQDPPGTTPFLAGEQALVLGHPMHPVPQSRRGMEDAEAERFSPELRGSFPLHWFAVAADAVTHDAELGRELPELLAHLGAPDGLPAGTIAVPAHPWQARRIAQRPGVRALLADGALRDLGPAGPAWHATSSLRTLYRADAPVMLKTSIGIEITNARREMLLPQLRRGLAVHRMLDAGLKRVLHGAHPGFDIVRDLGWLAVGTATGESGLELVVRDNPFGPEDRVVCVAGLVAPRPDQPGGTSWLGRLLRGLAAAAGRPVADVAEEWFARYLRVAVAPALWLYEEYGVALEAHQQNTLVVLDADGWPIGGRHRDTKGCCFSADRGGRLVRWLPAGGRDLGMWYPDDVVEERFGHSLVVNNVLGLVGALGAQRLASERALLGALRAMLAAYRRAHGPRPKGDGGLVSALLERPALRAKANLLTRVAGIDELARTGERRAVYVDIPNPIARDDAGHA
jgi:siderophore synthetase component